MGNENNYYLVPGSELNDIGDAIREKVETTTEYAVEEMADAIREISTGVELPDLTYPAAAGEILYGKEAIDENGNVLTGTIPIKTSSNLTVSGRTVSVPAGYYATNASKSISSSYIIPTGTKNITTTDAVNVTSYASAKVSDTDLKAENIKSGVNILGVAGTYKPVLEDKTFTANGTFESTSSDGFGKVTVNVDTTCEHTFGTKHITSNGTYNASIDGHSGFTSVEVNVPIPDNYIDTSDANATADDMIEGVTAYVKGEKIEGTIPHRASDDITVEGNFVLVPEGFYEEQSGATIPAGELSTVTITPSRSSDGLEYYVRAEASVKTSGYITNAENTYGTYIFPLYHGASEITPTTEDIIINPGNDATVFDKLVKVKSVPTQTKYITASSTSQTVLPDEGKFLSKVIVSPQQKALVYFNVVDGDDGVDVPEPISLSTTEPTWVKIFTHNGSYGTNRGKVTGASVQSAGYYSQKVPTVLVTRPISSTNLYQWENYILLGPAPYADEYTVNLTTEY